MSTLAFAPLTRAIALADPRAALTALAGLRHAFLLHTSAPDARSEWSFFGADPFAVYRGGSWEEARAAWRAHARVDDARREHAAPFQGGAVGYWSYDFGRRLERLPIVAHDDVGLPDFVVGLYDVVGAYHHATRQTWLFSTGRPLEGAEARTRARQRLDEFTRRLESLGPRAPQREARFQGRPQARGAKDSGSVP